MPRRIVVVGAGVTGLSCAILLQEAGYTVTIVSKDFPGFTDAPKSQDEYINYASPWGGAHNRWVPPTSSGEGAREHELALVTYRRMCDLSRAEPSAGITFMKGIEYLEAPPPEYLAMTEERAANVLHLPGFRLLYSDSFPDERVAWGCEYDTWCLNPTVYCSFLLRRFIIRGGQVCHHELRALAELFTMSATKLGIKNAEDEPVIDVVVNASGYGLGLDPSMSIIRGQTCVVGNPCSVTITRQNRDGSWVMCVPRGFEGGTVIGVTKEPDDWLAMPSIETRERMLKDFAATYPAILGNSKKFTVIADIVGRRPTRKGGPRIEGETLQRGAFVMHAYGLGGRGFELSWGVAEEVVKGVKDQLETAI